MSDGNPIRRHGTVEGSLYAALPMSLARDGSLSGNARSIALLLWSHKDGFETSAKAIASDLNLSRNTANKGIEELAASRWLAVEKWVTVGPSGQTREKGREYHLMLDKEPFTVDEHARYGAVHVVECAQKLSTVAAASSAPTNEGCPENEHGGAQYLSMERAQKLSTKEVHLVVQEEVQGDDGSSNPGLSDYDADSCGDLNDVTTCHNCGAVIDGECPSCWF